MISFPNIKIFCFHLMLMFEIILQSRSTQSFRFSSTNLKCYRWNLVLSSGAIPSMLLSECISRSLSTMMLFPSSFLAMIVLNYWSICSYCFRCAWHSPLCQIVICPVVHLPLLKEVRTPVLALITVLSLCLVLLLSYLNMCC